MKRSLIRLLRILLRKSLAQRFHCKCHSFDLSLLFALSNILNLTKNYVIPSRNTQKVLIEYFEKVIKGGDMYSSEQKLRSLILLDKSLISSHKSSEFVTYVQ